MSARPPLGLHAEIETADGTVYRWDANAQAQDRPVGIKTSTKLMEGFSQGSCTLARDVTGFYADLGIYDTLRFVGDDGRVAYEGRCSGFPRTLSDTHRIDAQSTGWMSHGRDRPMIAVYVDRDLSKWQSPGAQRRQTLVGAGFGLSDAATGDTDTIAQEFQGPSDPTSGKPCVETWYDAGPGNTIKAVLYSWSQQNTLYTDAGWIWRVMSTDDVLATHQDFTPSLASASPASGGFDPPNRYRYLAVQHLYTGATALTDGVTYGVYWTDIAVYGDEPVDRRGVDPGGFLASDLIKASAARYCPLLDTSGVMDSEHIIDQAVVADLTDPYDTWLMWNAYERWNLAVWENRKLTYAPMDTTSVDWIVRTDDPGMTMSETGPTIEAICNGIVVRYQDVTTGAASMITPDDDSSLADTDPTIPANRYGLDIWEPVQLPNPNTAAGAARIGQKILAEFNAQRQPGQLTIRGHIRDAAGNWQPGWMVRAGQTVIIEDIPDDRPRLINETGWDDDTKTLTLTLDGQAQDVAALLDQTLTDQKARTR